jgi:hypothetical protein
VVLRKLKSQGIAMVREPGAQSTIGFRRRRLLQGCWCTPPLPANQSAISMACS